MLRAVIAVAAILVLLDVESPVSDNLAALRILADESAAQMIRDDRIDLLVDLSQHSGHNRLTLFALKPAPVQISFAAYPGAAGLSTIDYHISDPYLDPPESEAHYVEKTLRLPDSYWLYNPVNDDAVNELPALAAGHITFGCLNNFCKINSGVLRLWGQIMSATPASRLIIIADEPAQERRVQRQLVNFSIAPDRITTTPRMPHNQYMLQYHRIDLTLDTSPYNGHISSLDALWMGVPVVTHVGPKPSGLHAAAEQVPNAPKVDAHVAAAAKSHDKGR